jgi:hypothetical protein
VRAMSVMRLIMTNRVAMCQTARMPRRLHDGI